MATLMYDRQWPRHAVIYGRSRVPYPKKRCQTVNTRYTRPIMSYGILLYTFRGNEPVFLLCQRRHTIEFVDIILSKTPRERLLNACSRLTEDERKKICEWTFDALWDDFLPEKNCRLYFEDKEDMRHRFERNKKDIQSAIHETTSVIPEPQWGFPKGKKNTKESNIACAIREFVEETGMDKSRIQIVDESNPFIERFVGSNGKIYGSQYFLAYAEDELQIHKNDFDGVSTISEEISELKWATYDEAIKVLSPERVDILQNAILCIRSNNTS